MLKRSSLPNQMYLPPTKKRARPSEWDAGYSEILKSKPEPATTRMSEAERILKDLGRKIDELVDKAKDASGEVREDLDEAIDALKKESRKFEEKVREAKERNEPKFQEAKVHLRTAMEEMNKAFQKMFRKGPEAEVMDDDK